MDATTPGYPLLTGRPRPPAPGIFTFMLEVRVLGPFEVVVDGTPTAVTAPLQQTLLATLALARRQALTRGQIIDTLWEYDPPANALNAVQQYVSALRTKIGRHHVASTSGGYLLDLAGGSVDAETLATLVARARVRYRAGDPGGARRLLEEVTGRAAAFVRGEPLAGLPDLPTVVAHREKLRHLVLEAQLLTAKATTDLGDAGESIAALETMTAAHPLDETVTVELMRAYVASGRQADALSAYEATSERLGEDLGVDPGPTLRNAHTAVLRQDPAFAPEAARSDRAALYAPVPVPADPLLGRQEDLAALRQLLRDPAARIITVLGPGGVGKTRLAIEIARQVREDRDVAYVPLAALRDPALMIPTVATALGVRMHGIAPSEDQLARAIADRDLLLVLDNVEQLLPDASLALARLVSGTGSVQLLLTSRERVRVSAEHRYLLGPLGLVGGVDDSPAVRLFTARAAAVDSTYRADDHAADVTEICRRLDGLPLAIELAAARTSVLPPAQLLARLDQSLQLLDQGPRDAPDRHASLRACLSWSIDTLTEAERMVLTTASVFIGGMTLNALEGVCNAHRTATSLGYEDGYRDGSGTGITLLSVVDALEAKSLLRLEQRPEGGRLVLLEVVRDYALELLEQSGDLPAVRSAHANQYHRLLGHDGPALYWPPRTTAEVLTVRADVPNARAAVSTLLEMGDGPAAAQVTLGLWPAWYHEGAWAEGDALSSLLLGRADIPDRLRARLNCILATCRAESGHVKEALSLIDGTLDLMDREPDPGLEIIVRSALVNLRGATEDPAWAARELELALDAGHRSGDPELASLATVAAVPPWATLSAQTIAAVENALRVAREHDNELLELLAMMTLSERLLTSTDPALLGRAAAWGREGHRIASAAGFTSSAAICLDNGATAALLAGSDPSAVLEDLRTCLMFAARAADTSFIVELLLRMGAAVAAAGDYELATTLHQSWHVLRDGLDLEELASNKRLHDTYLAPLGCKAGRDASWTLPLAIHVALGEVTTPAGAHVTRNHGFIRAPRKTSHL